MTRGCMKRCALGCVLAAAALAASAQPAADPQASACKTGSVVLRGCNGGNAQDAAQTKLKERVERSARSLQQRAELSPAATDLGTVIIEESRIIEPTDIERFRETLTRKEYLLGRQTYAGTRGDRDNFGTSFECGQSFDLQCKDQPGRPASTHWMNGR